MTGCSHDYNPPPEQVAILDMALAEIRSVPYTVTARWLFYRLLQKGVYRNGKADYKNKLIPIISRARKRFYGEWRPDTLADDTRKLGDRGQGWDSPAEWLEAVERQGYLKDKWHSQRNYVECWFEAEAMRSQFEYYLPHIPLLPFKGELSLDAKWQTAQRLQRRSEYYGHKMVVIYFGDDDPKGESIPMSAVADIRQWCEADFTFIRAGLNPGDGARLGLPENPDKPGTYQWEALDNENAERMIKGAVAPYFDMDALAEDEQDQVQVRRRLHDLFDDLKAELEGNGG
jgi:hypothetical protein